MGLNKKLRQKAEKAEKKRKKVKEEVQNENNNEIGNTMTEIFVCKYCEVKTKSRNEMEDHTVDAHHDRVGKLVQKFQDQNLESSKLLENVPECDLIFTSEEITHLAVDWKIHLEILKIIEENKI